MSAELEKLFSPDVLAALDERMRRIARESAPATSDDCWLTTKQAAKLTGTSEWTIRKLARLGLLEKYQPNPGRPPLRVKKSSLLGLDRGVIESASRTSDERRHDG